MDSRALLLLPAFAAAGYLLYLAAKEEKNIINNTIDWGTIKTDISEIFDRNEPSNLYPLDPDKIIGMGCISLDRNAYVIALRNIDNIMKYKTLADKASKKYGVPLALILAIIGVESNGNPKAYRYERSINDASRGLMQMLCRTARMLGLRGSCSQLYNPEISIDLGTKYLAVLYRKYKNWLDVIAAYNAGNILGKRGFGCYRNQRYVNKVVSYLKAFKDYKAL